MNSRRAYMYTYLLVHIVTSQTLASDKVNQLVATALESLPLFKLLKFLEKSGTGGTLETALGVLRNFCSCYNEIFDKIDLNDTLKNVPDKLKRLMQLAKLQALRDLNSTEKFDSKYQETTIERNKDENTNPSHFTESTMDSPVKPNSKRKENRFTNARELINNTLQPSRVRSLTVNLKEEMQNKMFSNAVIIMVIVNASLANESKQYLERLSQDENLQDIIASHSPVQMVILKNKTSSTLKYYLKNKNLNDNERFLRDYLLKSSADIKIVNITMANRLINTLVGVDDKLIVNKSSNKLFENKNQTNNSDKRFQYKQNLLLINEKKVYNSRATNNFKRNYYLKNNKSTPRKSTQVNLLIEAANRSASKYTPLNLTTTTITFYNYSTIFSHKEEHSKTSRVASIDTLHNKSTKSQLTNILINETTNSAKKFFLNTTNLNYKKLHTNQSSGFSVYRYFQSGDTNKTSNKTKYLFKTNLKSKSLVEVDTFSLKKTKQISKQTLSLSLYTKAIKQIRYYTNVQKQVSFERKNANKTESTKQNNKDNETNTKGSTYNNPEELIKNNSKKFESNYFPLLPNSNTIQKYIRYDRDRLFKTNNIKNHQNVSYGNIKVDNTIEYNKNYIKSAIKTKKILNLKSIFYDRNIPYSKYSLSLANVAKTIPMQSNNSKNIYYNLTLSGTIKPNKTLTTCVEINSKNECIPFKKLKNYITLINKSISIVPERDTTFEKSLMKTHDRISIRSTNIFNQSVYNSENLNVLRKNNSSRNKTYTLVNNEKTLFSNITNTSDNEFGYFTSINYTNLPSDTQYKTISNETFNKNILSNKTFFKNIKYDKTTSSFDNADKLLSNLTFLVKTLKTEEKQDVTIPVFSFNKSLKTTSNHLRMNNISSHLTNVTGKYKNEHINNKLKPLSIYNVTTRNKTSSAGTGIENISNLVKTPKLNKLFNKFVDTVFSEKSILFLNTTTTPIYERKIYNTETQRKSTSTTSIMSNLKKNTNNTINNSTIKQTNSLQHTHLMGFGDLQKIRNYISNTTKMIENLLSDPCFSKINNYSVTTASLDKADKLLSNLTAFVEVLKTKKAAAARTVSHESSKTNNNNLTDKTISLNLLNRTGKINNKIINNQLKSLTHLADNNKYAVLSNFSNIKEYSTVVLSNTSLVPNRKIDMIPEFYLSHLSNITVLKNTTLFNLKNKKMSSYITKKINTNIQIESTTKISNITDFSTKKIKYLTNSALNQTEIPRMGVGGTNNISITKAKVTIAIKNKNNTLSNTATVTQNVSAKRSKSKSVTENSTKLKINTRNENYTETNKTTGVTTKFFVPHVFDSFNVNKTMLAIDYESGTKFIKHSYVNDETKFTDKKENKTQIYYDALQTISPYFTLQNNMMRSNSTNKIKVISNYNVETDTSKGQSLISNITVVPNSTNSSIKFNTHDVKNRTDYERVKNKHVKVKSDKKIIKYSKFMNPDITVAIAPTEISNYTAALSISSNKGKNTSDHKYMSTINTKQMKIQKKNNRLPLNKLLQSVNRNQSHEYKYRYTNSTSKLIYNTKNVIENFDDANNITNVNNNKFYFATTVINDINEKYIKFYKEDLNFTKVNKMNNDFIINLENVTKAVTNLSNKNNLNIFAINSTDLKIHTLKKYKFENVTNIFSLSKKYKRINLNILPRTKKPQLEINESLSKHKEFYDNKKNTVYNEQPTLMKNESDFKNITSIKNHYLGNQFITQNIKGLISNKPMTKKIPTFTDKRVKIKLMNNGRFYNSQLRVTEKGVSKKNITNATNSNITKLNNSNEKDNNTFHERNTVRNTSFTLKQTFFDDASYFTSDLKTSNHTFVANYFNSKLLPVVHKTITINNRYFKDKNTATARTRLFFANITIKKWDRVPIISLYTNSLNNISTYFPIYPVKVNYELKNITKTNKYPLISTTSPRSMYFDKNSDYLDVQFEQFQKNIINNTSNNDKVYYNVEQSYSNLFPVNRTEISSLSRHPIYINRSGVANNGKFTEIDKVLNNYPTKSILPTNRLTSYGGSKVINRKKPLIISTYKLNKPIISGSAKSGQSKSLLSNSDVFLENLGDNIFEKVQTTNFKRESPSNNCDYEKNHRGFTDSDKYNLCNVRYNFGKSPKKQKQIRIMNSDKTPINQEINVYSTKSKKDNILYIGSSADVYKPKKANVLEKKINFNNDVALMFTPTDSFLPSPIHTENIPHSQFFSINYKSSPSEITNSLLPLSITLSNVKLRNHNFTDTKKTKSYIKQIHFNSHAKVNELYSRKISTYNNDSSEIDHKSVKPLYFETSSLINLTKLIPTLSPQYFNGSFTNDNQFLNRSKSYDHKNVYYKNPETLNNSLRTKHIKDHKHKQSLLEYTASQKNSIDKVQQSIKPVLGKAKMMGTLYELFENQLFIPELSEKSLLSTNQEQNSVRHFFKKSDNMNPFIKNINNTTLLTKLSVNYLRGPNIEEKSAISFLDNHNTNPFVKPKNDSTFPKIYDKRVLKSNLNDKLKPLSLGNSNSFFKRPQSRTFFQKHSEITNNLLNFENLPKNDNNRSEEVDIGKLSLDLPKKSVKPLLHNSTINVKNTNQFNQELKFGNSASVLKLNKNNLAGNNNTYIILYNNSLSKTTFKNSKINFKKLNNKNYANKTLNSKSITKLLRLFNNGNFSSNFNKYNAKEEINPNYYNKKQNVNLTHFESITFISNISKTSQYTKKLINNNIIKHISTFSGSITHRKNALSCCQKNITNILDENIQPTISKYKEIKDNFLDFRKTSIINTNDVTNLTLPVLSDILNKDDYTKKTVHSFLHDTSQTQHKEVFRNKTTQTNTTSQILENLKTTPNCTITRDIMSKALNEKAYRTNAKNNYTLGKNTSMFISNNTDKLNTTKTLHTFSSQNITGVKFQHHISQISHIQVADIDNAVKISHLKMEYNHSNNNEKFYNHIRSVTMKSQNVTKRISQIIKLTSLDVKTKVITTKNTTENITNINRTNTINKSAFHNNIKELVNSTKIISNLSKNDKQLQKITVLPIEEGAKNIRKNMEQLHKNTKNTLKKYGLTQFLVSNKNKENFSSKKINKKTKKTLTQPMKIINPSNKNITTSNSNTKQKYSIFKSHNKKVDNNFTWSPLFNLKKGTNKVYTHKKMYKKKKPLSTPLRKNKPVSNTKKFIRITTKNKLCLFIGNTNENQQLISSNGLLNGKTSIHNETKNNVKNKPLQTKDICKPYTVLKNTYIFKSKNNSTKQVAHENLTHRNTVESKNNLTKQEAHENMTHTYIIKSKNNSTIQLAHENMALKNTITSKNNSIIQLARKNMAHKKPIKSKNNSTVKLAHKNMAHKNSVKSKNNSTIQLAHKNMAHKNSIKSKNNSTKQLSFQNTAHKKHFHQKNHLNRKSARKDRHFNHNHTTKKYESKKIASKSIKTTSTTVKMTDYGLQRLLTALLRGDMDNKEKPLQTIRHSVSKLSEEDRSRERYRSYYHTSTTKRSQTHTVGKFTSTTINAYELMRLPTLKVLPDNPYDKPKKYYLKRPHPLEPRTMYFRSPKEYHYYYKR